MQSQFYQASTQHQHMQFLCKVILFFFCLMCDFSSVWGKNISATNTKSFKAPFHYFWHVFKTPVENTERIPQKNKTKPQTKPKKTHRNWCSSRILFSNNVILLSNLLSFLLFLLAHFHFFLLYLIKMDKIADFCPHI